MVASTHWLASAAGMAVLEAGGNAFDAAVAAGLVLQVVEPHLNGPGGEVPVIGYSARDGEAFVLDGQGPAPPLRRWPPSPALGHRPDSGQRAARRDGARRVRCLDAAARAVRHAPAARRHVLRDRLRADGYPMLPADQRRDRRDGGHVHASTGRRRPRSTWPAARRAREPFRQSGARGRPTSRILAEAEAAGRDREAQIEAARRACYEGFVAEAIDAFVARAPRSWTSPDGRTAACSTAADLAGVAGQRVEGRSPSASAGSPSARPARGARARSSCSSSRCSTVSTWPRWRRAAPSCIHPVTEVRQAGLRRPGGLVRRPAARRRAAGRPALARVRGAAPAAGRRARVGRPGAGRPGGRQPPCLATRSERRGRPRRRARSGRADGWAPRHWSAVPLGAGGHLPPGRRRPVREPGLRHPERRLAAELAGRSPGSASAWAPGPRCSRSAPGFASTLAPGRRPRTTLSPTASCCATASRTWRSAPRAATSRISGRWGSS